MNAHGGLLDVGMELMAGQQIRLSHAATEVITTGSVVRAEASEASRFSVAFEFESPAPYFCPERFPPVDWSNVESRA